MIRISEIKLELEQTQNNIENLLKEKALEKINNNKIKEIKIYKRSFDARGSKIWATYIIDVELESPEEENKILKENENNPHIQKTPNMKWQPPAINKTKNQKQRPIIIGFGPSGIFAALCLAQMGLSPIVYERGKIVRERTQDTWGLWRERKLNPNSNVQFGEGGAGTFSDGKLYSQIKDPRHLGRKVLEEFVKAGAPEDILYEAHPHIGTFRLVKMVENIRKQITELGGEIHFNHQLTDIKIQNGELKGITLKNLETNQTIEKQTNQVVLALGHSARDTFQMLYERGIEMQAKPFSIGVRIEHPQSLIDQSRWGKFAGNKELGAAEYRLVQHIKSGKAAGRSIYSFCMCPGGTVVAATSEAGQVVTNGMSQYSRAERNANSGIVVGTNWSDYPQSPEQFEAEFGKTHGVENLQEGQIHPLSAIIWQRQLERAAYKLGGENYNAPAQLLGDFLAGKASQRAGNVEPSYKPGVTYTDLQEIIPAQISLALKEAFPAFAQKIKGYEMYDAVMTGLETRTSSPLRIERGQDMQSTNIKGIYPAGEGAGYAGGILSASVDGIKIAEAVATAGEI